ncbi:hypothetical protein BNJ_00116 [Kaumoebavirus]|uniref:hypothetical protein n=1 Tax=Kaumoebavirus TaxID=1859492 RepID=UPI0009C39F92|nr:hypothetical protein BNJ_00116 [Kaumoebavirus]ARA71951.1 hypothetical protein BNJ_00116 [Kaumoebavirus]
MHKTIKVVLTQGIILKPIRRQLQKLLKSEEDEEALERFRRIMREIPYSFFEILREESPIEMVDVVETVRKVRLKIPAISDNPENIRRIKTAIAIARGAQKPLTIDLRECHGDIYFILGGFVSLFHGPLFSVESEKNYYTVAIEDGEVVKTRERLKCYQLPDDLAVICKVGQRTAAGGEILAAILREAGAKIVGRRTAGMLNIMRYCKFREYVIGFPTAYISTPTHHYFRKQYLSPKT